MNGDETEIQTLTGVPDDEVEETIEDAKQSDRYISHEVISEGGGLNTIRITVRKL